jgi:hypothetical protein
MLNRDKDTVIDFGGTKIDVWLNCQERTALTYHEVYGMRFDAETNRCYDTVFIMDETDPDYPTFYAGINIDVNYFDHALFDYQRIADHPVRLSVPYRTPRTEKCLNSAVQRIIRPEFDGILRNLAAVLDTDTQVDAVQIMQHVEAWKTLLTSIPKHVVDVCKHGTTFKLGNAVYCPEKISSVVSTLGYTPSTAQYSYPPC